jgi:hypothetical protein
MLPEQLPHTMKTKYLNTQWLIRITLIFCIVFLIFEISQIIRYAFSPNQMDFGEGFTMYIAKLWANGQLQWDPSQQPYMTLIYGVIYPAILKPFVLLFGPDLRIGRIICLIAAAVIGVFIFLIARKFTRNKYIPFIAALLPMLHPGYREWIMQARCDMVAIMFSVIGVYLAIRWQSCKKIYWSIPLFILAFFTKQTAIIGAGAICIYLLISNRKVFFKYSAILLVSGILIILIGNSLTNGQFFMQLWEYNKTVPFLWPQNKTVHNYQYVFYPTIIILAYVAIIIVVKRDLFKQHLIPILWLSVSIAVTCVLLFRKGAFINYGIEFIIISGLCFALLLEYVKPTGNIISGALISLQLVLCFSVNPIPMPDKYSLADISEVKRIIKDTQQPILTENAGLVLSSGKTPYYEPFIYTNLESLGYFDENIIINDLNDQRMDYLVLRSPATRTKDDHLNDRVENAINNNYQIVYRTFGGKFWYDFCVYESNKLHQERYAKNN